MPAGAISLNAGPTSLAQAMSDARLASIVTHQGRGTRFGHSSIPLELDTRLFHPQTAARRSASAFDGVVRLAAAQHRAHHPNHPVHRRHHGDLPALALAAHDPLEELLERR